MFAVVQNGAVRQILQMDVPFSVGDKHYSSNFLRTSSAQEKLEAGVWEIIEGQRPDDRFYWVSGPDYRVVEVNSTVEANYSGNPKDLDGLKKSNVAQAKAQAGSQLAATDWMVIRKMERGVDLPADAAAFRAAVVAECSRLETAMNGVASVEELISVIASQNWPATGAANE
jgi:hypothetical protein